MEYTIIASIPVNSGVTNLIHDRIVVVFISHLEVEANVAGCVHSSVNKPGANGEWVMRC